jgi:hypothetical protein
VAKKTKKVTQKAEGKKDIKALVEQSKKGGSQCWAAYLSDLDCKFYVAEVKRGLEAGEPIVFERVKEILLDVFGIEISLNSIKNHMKGKCKCRKEDSK